MTTTFTGQIESLAINESLEINGGGGAVRIDTSLVADELAFNAYILGKLNGKTVLCAGKNGNALRVPLRSGSLVPTNRRVEH